MKIPIPSFSPYVWAAGAVAVLLGICVAVWFLTAPQRAAQARMDAKVAQEAARAAKDSAAAAIDMASKTSEANTETQDVRRENETNIRSAEGSATAVDPHAAAAGRRGLCRYSAYSARPECVQHPSSK